MAKGKTVKKGKNEVEKFEIEVSKENTGRFLILKAKGKKITINFVTQAQFKGIKSSDSVMKIDADSSELYPVGKICIDKEHSFIMSDQMQMFIKPVTELVKVAKSFNKQAEKEPT